MSPFWISGQPGEQYLPKGLSQMDHLHTTRHWVDETEFVPVEDTRTFPLELLRKYHNSQRAV